jgi:hypothetical protein
LPMTGPKVLGAACAEAAAANSSAAQARMVMSELRRPGAVGRDLGFG